MVRDEATVYISSRDSILIVEYSLQCQRKLSVFLVTRPHLRIGSTVSLKPCLHLCSFKWLKYNPRLVSSLRPLVSYIAKTEFSLGLIEQEYFIYWNYVSNFFAKCTPFLNRVWIKRLIKSFGSSTKSLHLMLTCWPCLVLSIIIMIYEGMRASVNSQLYEWKISYEIIFYLPEIQLGQFQDQDDQAMYF